MKFGSTVAQAASYGFDLDNDVRHLPDNTIGKLFAGLSAQLNVDAAIAAGINSGDVVTPSSLRAHNLNTDPFASAQLYPGVPQHNPVLTGGGHFTIDSTASAGAELLGSVENGQFSGGPGVVPVRLGMVAGHAPIELHLLGARIAATCDANRCTNGKLGGAVATTEVDAVLLPALADVMQSIVAAQCPGAIPASCGPIALTLLALLDANHDGAITVAELRQNALTQAVLLLDEDVLNADGTPGHDGVNESVSIGIGFTAKAAVFDIAGESYPRPSDFPPRPTQFTPSITEAPDTSGGASGTGTAPGLGRLREHSTEAGGFAPCSGPTTWDFFGYPVITFEAVLAIDTARGDRVCIEYLLTITDTDHPLQGIHFSLAGSCAIRGGTGRFADATGGGTITGSCTSPEGDPLVTCRETWSGASTALG